MRRSHSHLPAILVAVLAAACGAAEPHKDLIMPGEVFAVGGRTAFVFTPQAATGPATGPRPWILYAPTLPGLPE